MDYSKMTLSELKKSATLLGIDITGLSKAKLIEKIEEAKLRVEETEETNVTSLVDDMLDDIAPNAIEEETPVVNVKKENDTSSVIKEITEMIEDIGQVENKDYSNEIPSIGLDELIPCMSIIGGVTYVSKTNNAKWKWNEIGSIQYLPMSELITMNNNWDKFLNKPWIILKDERAVKYFRLQELYERVAKVNNLKALFNTCDLEYIGDSIDDAIAVGMRDVLIAKIGVMYKAKTLNDINIIRLLEKKLKFDLIGNEE